jgi:DNA-directed RNA polymerase subunit RPC12/RpoP
VGSFASLGVTFTPDARGLYARAMGHGVACGRCGASTPLPDDLRVPSFRCAYCGAELATSAYVGKDIASAEQVREHFRAIVADPRHVAQTPMPRFESTNAATRASTCRHCGAPVAVPLDLRAKTFECPACKKTDYVTAHVSDKERFALDMQRQMAGNQALAQLRAAGVPCQACGARNAIVDPAAVQVVCTSCGAAILVSDHVASDAVARSRLKQGLVEMRAGLAESQKRQARTNVIIVVVVVVAVAIILPLALYFGRR